MLESFEILILKKIRIALLWLSKVETALDFMFFKTKKTDDSSVITFASEVGKNDDPVQMNKHCPNQGKWSCLLVVNLRENGSKICHIPTFST